MKRKRGLSLLMAAAVTLSIFNFSVASAAEYREMLKVAETQTIDAKGEAITYAVPVEKQIKGRDLKFTADWTRPQTGSKPREFQLKLRLKEGDAEETTAAVLGYKNNKIFYFKADGSYAEAGVGFGDLVTSDAFPAGSWGSMILELDMTNGRFRLTISGNSKTSGTEYLDLPFAAEDWQEVVLTGIVIEKTETLKSEQSVKNAVLSYLSSKQDELHALIDALPQGAEVDKISYGDIEALNITLAEIDVYFNEGVAADSEHKAVYDAVIAKLADLENDKAGKFTYLVGRLPAEITASNYQDYDAVLAELAEILSENPDILSQVPDEIEVYEAIKKKIVIIGGEIELDGLFDDIAEYKNKVDKQNLASINSISVKIEELLQNPDITYNASKKAVYDDIMAAVDALQGEYDRYITMDISNSYNAKMYADLAEATLDNPEFYAPNFSGANINYLPEWVMNKKTVKNALDVEGVIYSDKKLPIYIDTTGGIIIGTAGDNTISEITIPIQRGYYESVSVATRASYALKDDFGYKVNYSDGSEEIFDCDYGPMWKGSPSGFGIQLAANQIDIAYDLRYIEDWIKFSKGESDETLPLLLNSDNSTPEYELNSQYPNLLVPVLTLATDPKKIVESVTISVKDKTCIDVLGITATLPAEAVAKESVEIAIQGLKSSGAMASDSKIELEAISTVMDRYMAAAKTDKNIADIDTYNTLKETYDSNVVTVIEKTALTDWRNAIARFEFLNPINEAAVDNYVSVTQKGAEFKDYTVEVTDGGKTLEVVIDNNLDYNREFVVTVSGLLTSGGSDKTFTLGQSSRVTLKPAAPVAIDSIDLKNENGSALENLSTKNHGDKVKVFVDLLNSSITPKQEYSMSIGLYDASGKLIKGYVRNNTLDIGKNRGETFDFTLDLTNGANEIRCFVMESYKTMREFDYAEIN